MSLFTTKLFGVTALMSYLNLSISILENYTDKSIHQIALLTVELLQNSLNFQGLFEIVDVAELEVGSVFLRTTDPIAFPESFREDFLNFFTNFPDVCFCLFVLDDCDDTASEYRVLFFNNKAVTQYPEIRYEDFRPNDFEYESSDKILLKTDKSMGGKTIEELYEKAKKRGMNERIAKLVGMIECGSTAEPDPVVINFIKKSLFGNIIAESAQDA